ncbi:unnamed protein product [Paramecium pentaurelia]|uniref:Transmembrane protein n=1 Tax=Paramecium pentaurelia TaxID=43138 RepID=A0A8S1U7B0_9CILI|nr:unnamed protein product [Paramecium pentaurelia]
MNIILDRQTSFCYFSNSSNISQVDQFDQKYISNNICDLTNFGYYNITNNQNYTLVTAVNNQFFVLQNSKQIQIVDQFFEYLQLHNYSNLNFTDCLKSTSYNLTLSSICQNDTAQYWLSISFDSNGIVIDMNSFSIPNRFTNVSKINNIANLNFILGTYDSYYSNLYGKLYLFNSSNSSMQQLYDYNFSCQDFSVALYNLNSDINEENLVIILYIIDYLAFSQYIFIRNNSISFQEPSALMWIYNNIFGVQIQILQIINDELFMLITSIEGVGQFLVYSLKQYLFERVRYIITSIPAYGDLKPNTISIYSNGYLLQQFKKGYNYIIGVYQISKLLNNNLEEPILMLESINSTSLEYALISNLESQNPTCLTFNDGSVLYYPIYTRTLKCHYRIHKKDVQVNTQCMNEFSNGSYELTFILPDLDIPKSKSIYTLLIIITAQLIAFYILIKYRMRNIGYINTEIEI